MNVFLSAGNRHHLHSSSPTADKARIKGGDGQGQGTWRSDVLNGVLAAGGSHLCLAESSM